MWTEEERVKKYKHVIEDGIYACSLGVRGSCSLNGSFSQEEVVEEEVEEEELVTTTKTTTTMTTTVMAGLGSSQEEEQRQQQHTPQRAETPPPSPVQEKTEFEKGEGESRSRNWEGK